MYVLSKRKRKYLANDMTDMIVKWHNYGVNIITRLVTLCIRKY